MEGQLNFLDNPAPQSDSSADCFACCAAYRQCSDAKKCLFPAIGAECSYRANLEAGRIFYGRNSIYFNAETFDKITRKVSGFHAGAAAALDRILSYLCEYCRGASSCIIRNEWVDELDSLGIFDIKPLGPLFPALCSAKSLANLVQTTDRQYYSIFQEAQAERDKADSEFPGSRTKGFLMSWLNASGASYRDILASPYRCLYKKPEFTVYIDELYTERFPSSRADRCYSMSPLAADGLLLPSQIKAEEDRLAQWTKRHKK